MTELVDVENVCEEDNHEPKWQIGFKEAEGRKHKMVRVGMRSLYTRAPEVS